MRIAILFLYLFLAVIRSSAYSVLTHEAIIDVCWDKDIQPLLLMKYPGATQDQLNDARAYAYGGAVAPDIGYYPHGAKLFTDLVHYVRSGDFVTALLEESKNINDYAFALGALCHYHADKYGHPIGTNRCVPIAYPKDLQRFGDTVTYEQDPLSHVRIEFGFDVLQTARGNYANTQYHKYIGFKVPQDLMERAFYKTYGIELNTLFKDLPKAIGSFRWVVRSLMPLATKAAWASKKKEISKANPSMTRRKFEYNMKRNAYIHEYGNKRDKPGVGASVLAWVFKVTPKVGPLKKYKIKVPGKQEEDIFIRSFDTVVVHYKGSIHRIPDSTSCFANIDYDTGKDVAPGEYGLADKSYGVLVLKLKENNYKTVTRSLQRSIMVFYSRPPKGEDHNSPEDQKRITAAVSEIRSLPAASLPE